MHGGIWSFTGVVQPSPLGTKFASISATATSTPGVPYPIPWNNWGTADIHSSGMSTNEAFVVAFINEGDYTTSPRVMPVLSPVPSILRSFVYLNAESPPNWYYLTSGDSVVTWMIRAYVSFAATGISQSIELTPSSYKLNQNFPNPFNPSTTIRFEIPSRSFVTLKVYDLVGREVATLVNGIREAGAQEVEFHASNLPSGVYLYRITTDKFVETKKLVLIK